MNNNWYICFRCFINHLGTTPERTVAVEDSRNGILSASRAGMRVAMVPDLLPPTPELEPLLWGRFDSLLQLRDRLAKELD